MTRPCVLLDPREKLGASNKNRTCPYAGKRFGRLRCFLLGGCTSSNQWEVIPWDFCALPEKARQERRRGKVNKPKKTPR